MKTTDQLKANENLLIDNKLNLFELFRFAWI